MKELTKSEKMGIIGLCAAKLIDLSEQTYDNFDSEEWMYYSDIGRKIK